MNRQITRRGLVVTACAVVVAGLLVTVAGVVGWLGAPGPEPPPQRRPVDAVASAGKIRPLPAAAPLSITVPVVDLHTEVGVQPPAENGTVIPPTADRAYWLDDYGAIGADADTTAYLIGHSAAVGPAAFNALVDREQGRSSLYAGDEIVVTTEHGDVVYIVQSTTVYDQRRLDDIADLWNPKAGRLVLISCLFDAEGRATGDNVVVYARLAPQSSGEPTRGR
ncbi:class F sortase [uncultured Aeromicrobium sp.]|uniref:class F sortase n=1 Tax=uncultured Aeromicrobium sp. TaxID=337820 RepID=UPI0025E1C00E|nr:class F sortase [uncultured Aeromicrobium sp.]